MRNSASVLSLHLKNLKKHRTSKPFLLFDEGSKVTADLLVVFQIRTAKLPNYNTTYESYFESSSPFIIIKVNTGSSSFPAGLRIKFKK